MMKSMVLLSAFLLVVSGCATVQGVKQDVSGIFKRDGSGAAAQEVESRSGESQKTKAEVVTPAPAKAQPPCVKNFTVEGNFFTGRRYKSYQEFTGISKDAAFNNVLQHIATTSYKIVNSNKDAGIISASHEVIMGDGASIPLNIVMKNQGKNLRVELLLALTGGVVASEDEIREEFCTVLAAVK